MKKGCLLPIVIIGGLLILALIFIVPAIGYRNSLATMDEGINNQWHEIDNQLLRRSDLIPNLVNTVKGYAKHEKDVFTNLQNARNQLLAANTDAARVQAAGTFEGALNRLIMVTENYPNLKADAEFIRLMDNLEGTENRLAVARKRYNDAVNEFNAKIRRFPGSLFAWGYKAHEYFEIPEMARTTPQVDFNQ